MPHHLRSPFGTPLELKTVGDDGTFEGYASLFNREDLGHDVILPGAFTESLAKRSAAGIKLLFQHDPAEPIGIWNSIREDQTGLFALIDPPQVGITLTEQFLLEPEQSTTAIVFHHPKAKYFNVKPGGEVEFE